MVTIPEIPAMPTLGKYVAYVGRISPEKGIDTFLQAACRSGLPTRVAGELPSDRFQPSWASPNVEFVGRLGPAQLESFYQNARIVVVPSVCLEAFSLTCAEAMAYGVPVVASRIGGLQELVDDGETGLLFPHGDFESLAAILRDLWHKPGAISRLGRAGRQKASTEFSPGTHYRRLMQVYESVIRPRGLPL